MTRSTVLLAVTLLAGLAAASGWRSATPQSAPPDRLRIATWNLEWLIAPEEFRALARDCVPRDASPGPRRRFIPCNVAAEHERSTADFRALERYARLLDADVIAVQEGQFTDIPTDKFQPGDSGTITVPDTPGEVPYYCSLHGTPRAGMVGRLLVVADK